MGVRESLLALLGWAGALQVVTPSIAPADTAAKLLGLASLLATLTVLAYRLGVWRQEMENTKQNVVAQVAASYDEIQRRLDAIDHMLTDFSQQRDRLSRWQSRTDRRLSRLERADKPLDTSVE